MPKDQKTGKSRGFAFLMYEDQRSTVLAVDNLGGAKVLERTLRVDHALNYKQLEHDDETGKMKERDEARCVLLSSRRACVANGLASSALLPIRTGSSRVSISPSTRMTQV